jgi:UDP-glucose 4-epimerase
MRNGTDRRRPRRRAVVTGGAGFIGSHLCDRLVADGCDVVAVDDLSSGTRDNLQGALDSGRCRLVTADVADLELMDRLAADTDVVFHLAATVGVRRAVEEPRLVIENNIQGTDSVLRGCARYGTPVIVASSSEVYGRNADAPLREDADRILGPPQVQRWSYSASKGIDEMLAFAFHAEYGLPVTVARFFNTTGPRQSSEYGMVVPRFVQAALAGEPLVVYGDGSQSRCFCHVADTVDALVRLASTDAISCEVVNVGSTEEITVADLAELTLRLVREEVPGRELAEPGMRFVPYEDAFGAGFEDTPRRVPAVDRLRALTGWERSRGIEDIVREMIHLHAGGDAPGEALSETVSG